MLEKKTSREIYELERNNSKVWITEESLKEWINNNTNDCFMCKGVKCYICKDDLLKELEGEEE